MAEGPAPELFLKRVRGIVGGSREKRLSGLLEKRRRRWRKDCKKRNVSIPRVTYNPDDDVVRARKEALEELEQLLCEYESSVDVLTETRKKMMEDVRALETSRVGEILHNIVSDENSPQHCE